MALFRPHQWPKNLVVFTAPFLQGDLWTLEHFLSVTYVSVLFTCAASAVYVTNDIADRERDREHPVKRHRPVASGEVGVRHALLLAAAPCALLAAGIVARPSWAAVAIVCYLALNLLYSGRLKHVALLDVFVLAAGFLLRTTAGGLATGGRISPWLVVCVLSVTLLLGFGKRRHEIAQHAGPVGVTGTGTDAGSGLERQRPALHGYSLHLADVLITVTGAVTVIAYVSFLRNDLAPQAHGWLLAVLSTPLAMFVLARYLQILLVEEGGGDPVRVLVTDRPLVCLIVVWCLCFAVAPLVTAAGAS